MKRFFPLAITLLIMLAIGIVGVEAWITYNGPFHPGSPFFRLQVFGEQVFERLIPDDTGRAEYALSVLLRRSSDLRFVTGTEYEALALEYLNQAIDQAASAVAAAPAESATLLRPELLEFIQAAETALQNLKVVRQENPEFLAALTAKVSVLRTMLSEPGFVQENFRLLSGITLQNQVTATPAPPPQAGLATRTPSVTIQPHVVLFPPGSPGALHKFYPLTGKHAQLDCLSCHSEGRFAGTANLCESCHLEMRPAGHFPGECSLCHYPSTWSEIHFEHAGSAATDCAACHTIHRPPGHSPGQCSSCHTTSAWTPASFNHEAVGATDCAGCHSNRKPANHYDGQCSACHSTSPWTPATFDHQAAGATNCAGCHSNRKPANHYDGQCSSCHTTSAWTPARFNHEAVGATDCAGCHSNRKPANHYDGQCSACHTTSSWTPASFNHQAAGATDCMSCHSARRPANHYEGQCSQCHNTSSWAGATFNHSFPINHKGANGQCSLCHPSGGSAWTCYNCHDQAETEKHHDEKDIFDIASHCISCHPTGDD